MSAVTVWSRRRSVVDDERLIDWPVRTPCGSQAAQALLSACRLGPEMNPPGRTRAEGPEVELELRRGLASLVLSCCSSRLCCASLTGSYQPRVGIQLRGRSGLCAGGRARFQDLSRHSTLAALPRHLLRRARRRCVSREQSESKRKQVYSSLGRAGRFPGAAAAEQGKALRARAVRRSRQAVSCGQVSRVAASILWVGTPQRAQEQDSVL